MANRCACGAEAAKGRRYCSIECYRKSTRNAAYTACQCCGVRFTPVLYRSSRGRFRRDNNPRKACSAECASAVVRMGRTEKQCLSCGISFSPVRWREGKAIKDCHARFCSHECRIQSWWDDDRRLAQSKRLSGENHFNWYGGSGSFSWRGVDWPRIAERCRDLHDRTCKHCGMTEEQSKAKGWGRLQVNHIVPFHQWQNKEAANRQGNLEALCKSCHTKADWKWRKDNPVQVTLDIFD